jgi:putative tricarboxylic transport membrane protein
MERMILRRLLNADVAIALVMLVLGGYWTVAAVPYGLWRGSTPGTGFLPFWYGVLIVLLALAILVQRLRITDDRQAATESPVKPLLILLIVAVAIIGLEVVGFIPSILATLLLLFIVVERLPIVASAVVAVVTTAVLYLMFEKWLGVPLPHGLLGA